jgi:hypothetical protein
MDLNGGRRVDEVVMVTTGTIGDRPETYDGAGFDRADEFQPGEHIVGLVSDFRRRPLIFELTVY